MAHTQTTTKHTPAQLTLSEKYRAEAWRNIRAARRTCDHYWRGVYIERANWCRKMARWARGR